MVHESFTRSFLLGYSAFYARSELKWISLLEKGSPFANSRGSFDRGNRLAERGIEFLLFLKAVRKTRLTFTDTRNHPDPEIRSLYPRHIVRVRADDDDVSTARRCRGNINSRRNA